MPGCLLTRYMKLGVLDIFNDTNKHNVDTVWRAIDFGLFPMENAVSANEPVPMEKWLQPDRPRVR